MAKKKNVDVWSNYTLGIDNEISEIEVDKESKTSENPDIQKSENANVQTSENVDIQKTTPEVNRNTLKKGKNGKKKLSYIDRGWETVTMYLSPRAKKKLAYQRFKEQKNFSEILDELILNNL